LGDPLTARTTSAIREKITEGEVMLLPNLSVGFVPSPGTDSDTGVAPSFCTPCVLGKRICGLPFSPSVEDCGGGGGGGCTKIGPCLPIINKQLCCSLSGGCSLVDC